MKELLFTTFVLLCSFLPCTSQTVNIPDANFLNALISKGIDTSGDGIIQVSEAAVVTQLNVGNSHISSLEGIQAFVNLKAHFELHN